MTWSKADRIALVAALILALAGALASYLVAGATLGLLIGGVGFATLITAPMAIAVSRRALRAALAVVVSFGIAVVWIAALRDARHAIVLIIYAFALAGFLQLLISLRMNGPLASACVTLIALAWLSWPIWLAPQLSRQRIVNALVVAHPIFALNAISPELGVWTQQPLMYRLTTLGQDVPYRFPPSIWACVLGHGIIAMGLLLPDRPANPAAAGDAPSDR